MLPTLYELFFELLRKFGKILSAIIPELIINFAPESRLEETFSINNLILSILKYPKLFPRQTAQRPHRFAGSVEVLPRLPCRWHR